MGFGSVLVLFCEINLASSIHLYPDVRHKITVFYLNDRGSVLSLAVLKILLILLKCIVPQNNGVFFTAISFCYDVVAIVFWLGLCSSRYRIFITTKFVLLYRKNCC